MILYQLIIFTHHHYATNQFQKLKHLHICILLILNMLIMLLLC